MEISDSEGSIEISSPVRVPVREPIAVEGGSRKRAKNQHESQVIEHEEPVRSPVAESSRTQGEKNPANPRTGGEDEFAELDAWLESGEVEIF